MKIALIHTVKSVAKKFDIQLKERVKDVEVINLWDEHIAKSIEKNNGFLPEDIERLRILLHLAESTHADLILATCSSLSIEMEKLRDDISIPVITIDEAMLTTAVETTSRITILATAESTIGPTSAHLNVIASKQNKEISIDAIVVPEAYDDIRKGDKAEHDKKIISAFKELSDREVIVLAQASMAHLQKDLQKLSSCPVLASIQMAIEHVANILEKVVKV